MIWRFSDGTVATLGGEIEGATLFAQELRALLARDRVGVALYPDGHGAWLDRNDPMLFDAWLTQEMSRGFRREVRLRMTERPKDIPAVPPDVRGDLGLGEGARY